MTLGIVIISMVAGCSSAERDSTQGSPSPSNAVGDSPHTRSDVLFARDIIEHGAQAVTLSNLVVGNTGVNAEVIDVARRITANNTGRTTELQALLLEWGFTPMAVSPVPPAAQPGVAVQPGEHPLATDADYRAVRDSVGPQANDEFLQVMIRQNEFTISAALSELQYGSHPRALAMARSLIEDQQLENSAMQALQR